MDDVGAKHLERAAKDDGRRDAVAIVVAVDGDALLPLDGRKNALHRLRHVRKLERIVQVVERRMEKSLRPLRLSIPRIASKRATAGLIFSSCASRVSGLVVAGETLPEVRNQIFTLCLTAKARRHRIWKEMF